MGYGSGDTTLLGKKKSADQWQEDQVVNAGGGAKEVLDTSDTGNKKNDILMDLNLLTGNSNRVDTSNCANIAKIMKFTDKIARLSTRVKRASQANRYTIQALQKFDDGLKRSLVDVQIAPDYKSMIDPDCSSRVKDMSDAEAQQADDRANARLQRAKKKGGEKRRNAITKAANKGRGKPSLAAA